MMLRGGLSVARAAARSGSSARRVRCFGGVARPGWAVVGGGSAVRPRGLVAVRAATRTGGSRRALSRQAQQGEQPAQQEAAEYKGFLGMENSHAVYGIMAANVAVFLAWHESDDVEFMKRHFTLSMDNLKAGRVHTMVTSIFSHNEINRLIFSTVALFLASRPAVAVLGQPRFLALYLAGGIATAVGGLAVASQSSTARKAPPMTWRFGSNGAVLTVSAFAAACVAGLPLQAKLTVLPALVLPVAVFGVSGMHSEGDFAHFAGLLLGVGAFAATRRNHRAWAALVPKYHSK